MHKTQQAAAKPQRPVLAATPEALTLPLHGVAACAQVPRTSLSLLQAQLTQDVLHGCHGVKPVGGNLLACEALHYVAAPADDLLHRVPLTTFAAVAAQGFGRGHVVRRAA